MPLIDDKDINVLLPEDRFQAENLNLLEDIKEDAERIIRGNLAGYVSSAAMLLWVTPEATPALVRAIGGRLAAALAYRRIYAEDSIDDPQYAQTLYDQAMAWLMGIQAGTLVLEEVPTESIGLTIDMFYPNDPATDPPKFTMSSQF